MQRSRSSELEQQLDAAGINHLELSSNLTSISNSLILLQIGFKGKEKVRKFEEVKLHSFSLFNESRSDAGFRTTIIYKVLSIHSCIHRERNGELFTIAVVTIS